MQFNKKFRVFGIIVGVLVLAGLVGIMALTVQRAQQLTSTITRPKAVAVGCTGTGYQDVGVCGGGGYQQGDMFCGCGDPASTGKNCKTGIIGDYSCRYVVGDSRCWTSKKINCSIKTTQSDCETTPGCNWDNGNACWTYQPIPQNGTTVIADGTKATFNWSWNTTWSSTVSSAVIYVWSCAAKTDSCLVWTAGGQGLGYTSASITSPSQLQESTQYWWGVNPNSYYPPDPKYLCMPSWNFITGVKPAVHYSCQNKTCAIASGATADANGCTAAGGTCCAGDCAAGQTCDTTKAPNSCISSCSGSTPDFCGSACTNKQTDVKNCGTCGKACTSGQVCTNGSCVAGSSTCNVDSDCSGGTVCAFP